MNIYKKYEDKWTLSNYNWVKENNEHCLFDPKSSTGKGSLMLIRLCIRWMIFSVMLGGYLAYQLSPFLPLAFWIFFIAWIVKGAVENKMSTGYPYLEHTDSIGIGFVGLISFVIIAAIIAFWIYL